MRSLAELLRDLPDEALVPVGWVRERLPAGEAAPFTVSQVAERLQRSRSTVRAWAEAGHFPGAVKVGRDWRVPVEALTAFLAGRRPGGAAADLGAWKRKRRTA